MTLLDEKSDVDRVEKAYDAMPPNNDAIPEQDWTAEEESAIV